MVHGQCASLRVNAEVERQLVVLDQQEQQQQLVCYDDAFCTAQQRDGAS